VEGGNDANDWYDWERSETSGVVEPAGAACDHVHRYPEDIGLLAEAGLECYRFSVEWSRIEPDEGRFSQGWLEHYRAVAACCAKHGMLAIPTLHHFTNPRWIAREVAPGRQIPAGGATSGDAHPPAAPPTDQPLREGAARSWAGYPPAGCLRSFLAPETHTLYGVFG
jgi:beta-glucosidase/6-phospho-beta-glucosidase/beta-galactosidase